MSQNSVIFYFFLIFVNKIFYFSDLCEYRKHVFYASSRSSFSLPPGGTNENFSFRLGNRPGSIFTSIFPSVPHDIFQPGCAREINVVLNGKEHTEPRKNKQ